MSLAGVGAESISALVDDWADMESASTVVISMIPLLPHHSISGWGGYGIRPYTRHPSIYVHLQE